MKRSTLLCVIAHLWKVGLSPSDRSGDSSKNSLPESSGVASAVIMLYYKVVGSGGSRPEKVPISQQIRLFWKEQ